ncbi:nuclear respiratory factor 1-like [Lampetra fluviatilis]
MDGGVGELVTINGHHAAMGGTGDDDDGDGGAQAQGHALDPYGTQGMLEGDDSSPSSGDDDNAYDDSDILNATVADEVTAHLAAAGPVGMAAAAAVATGKKRKRPHIFESNPSIRKRQQTRLLRKLRSVIDEYTTRVGQQAVVLCLSPSKPNPVFKVFGAAPLENVVRKYKNVMLSDLELALTEHAPTQSDLHPELPPLTIDGIPVSVDKMTQAQLRAFIPEMLKFSTSRGKPGWGKETCRPMWWPPEVPWANVRSDVRSEDQKQRVSWTHALRTVVKNCYKHHGREDLLYAFDESALATLTTPHGAGAASHTLTAQLVHPQAMVQAISPDGVVSLIQVDAGTAAALAESGELPQTVTVTQVSYPPNCSDGEVGRDWTTLHNAEMTLHASQDASHAVATLAEVAAASQRDGGRHPTTVTMAINSDGVVHAVTTLSEASLQDGQLVLSGDGTTLTTVHHHNGIPIPVSVYPTMLGGHAVTVTPVSTAHGDVAMETFTVTPVTSVLSSSGESITMETSSSTKIAMVTPSMEIVSLRPT